jgi:hypothetical protein
VELLCFLLPSSGLMDNTQGYYEIHSILLLVCKVARGVKAGTAVQFFDVI